MQRLGTKLNDWPVAEHLEFSDITELMQSPSMHQQRDQTPARDGKATFILSADTLTAANGR